MADTSTALKEIFDEMFTLLEDLETRNVAILEYLGEQGGVTDEKLKPYLDRAGAASNVKWRAARVRMEYLLAPAPKSTTEQGKGDKSKASQARRKEKEPESGGSKERDKKEQGKKTESEPGITRSDDEGADKNSQNAKPVADGKAKDNDQDDAKKGKEAEGDSKKGAEAQASALADDNKSDTHEDENGKNQAAQSDSGKSASQ